MFKIPVFLFFLLLSLFAFEAENIPSVNIYVFNDVNRSYNIQDIIESESSLFIDKLRNEKPRFAAEQVLWLKIQLINNSTENVKKVVQFLDIRLDKMEIYTANGTLQSIEGDRVPFSGRFYGDAQIALDITADAKSENVVYVRFTNENKSDLTYKDMDKKSYIESVTFKKEVHAFFFGALLIMFVYNIVLFLFIGERVFLVYVLYHGVLLVVMFYYNGLVSQFYFPNSYDINGGNVPSILSFAAIILAMQFLRLFLSLKDYTPKLDRILVYFLYLNTLLLILSPFKILPVQIAIVNMMPLSLYLLFVAFYHAFVLKRGLALFYLFGWLVMLVAIFLTGLLSIGVIERNDFTSYIFQIGIFIEIALLSMGLAYRYKLNQEQLIEKTKVLHEQAKLASMGEMLRHISHQWRQPLSEINSVAMKIDSDYRRDTLDENSLDKNLEQIENLTEHMSKTIQDFNGYFKSDKKRESVVLEEVVDKSISLVLGGMLQSDIKIEKDITHHKQFFVVEGELIQVLLVLLNNARDVIKERDNGVEKWIKVSVRELDGHTIIEVEDSGGGINPSHLTKVFEPYFTTKFESQGVGIGLYMSKMIVEESLGGKLKVVNTVNGAKFIITL